MSMLEGLPSDGPMVVTSLVIALLLKTLNRSTSGSIPMRSRNLNFREKRRSNRFCQGYRYAPERRHQDRLGDLGQSRHQGLRHGEAARLREGRNFRAVNPRLSICHGAW